MTKAVQRRRGTNAEHASFTGLEGELSVNTTNDSVHVHDGTTAGGFELARADGSNVGNFNVDGDLDVTGNVTIGGNITIGDADTDSININADLTSSLIPNADDTYDIGSASKQWRNLYVDGTAEIDSLSIDGTVITATAAELNLLDGVTATTAEINYLDGVTSNIQTQLDALQDSDADLTAIAALSSADGNFIVGSASGWVAESGDTAIASLGITASSAELNILDGVTATTSELNTLDGITATVTELNYTDGVTSSIQGQLDDKAALAGATFTGNIGFDSSATVSLDVGDRTDAVHIPVGTTAQRPTAAAGMFRYNSTLSQFEGYTTEWGAIGGGGGSNTFTRDAFTGDGSTTDFTLSQAIGDENDLLVFNGGVFQNQDAYTVSGTTLSFDTAPANGNTLIVYSVVAAVSGSNLNQDSFSGDGSTTAFTLSINPVNENNTQVFIDGVYQQKDAYSTSGTTLTFSAAPASGTTIEVMTFTQTEINVPVDGTITPAKIASGDFYFDTDTLYIDATNNRVGIGTSSPSSLLHLSSNAPTIQFSETDVGIENYIQASGGGFNFFADDSNAVASTKMGFYVDGSERMRILSSGGITFNGDTSTANALDDYEEGTWTPAISGLTLTPSGNTYTKIGNLVTVTTYISVDSGTPTAGTLEITGIPYNVANQSVGSAMLSYVDYPAGALQYSFYAFSNRIRLYYNTDNSGWVAAPQNVLSTSSDIILTITYQAA